MIFSQWCKGLSEALEHVETAGGRDVAEALRRASEAAYAAVLEPVEGTLLTVVREAAEAAGSGRPTRAGAGAVLRAGVRAARKAVAQTPALLEVLREAGVVDAGGEGFVTILRGALAAVKVIDEKVNYSAIRVEVEKRTLRGRRGRRPAPPRRRPLSFDIAQKSRSRERAWIWRRRGAAWRLWAIASWLSATPDDEIHIHTNSPGLVSSLHASGASWSTSKSEHGRTEPPMDVCNRPPRRRRIQRPQRLPGKRGPESPHRGVVAVVRGEGLSGDSGGDWGSRLR